MHGSQLDMACYIYFMHRTTRKYTNCWTDNISFLASQSTAPAINKRKKLVIGV